MRLRFWKRERERERSEFGKGIVVCLAKFSEHLFEHGPYSERVIRQYAEEPDQARMEELKAEAAKFPQGDSAQYLARMAVMDIGTKLRDGSREASISLAIELWMNAASDHFYDLDRDRAPAPLIELADLCLLMGHGFTGRTWTIEDVDRIRELWKESCLAVDRMLGLRPDWGAW